MANVLMTTSMAGSREDRYLKTWKKKLRISACIGLKNFQTWKTVQVLTDGRIFIAGFSQKSRLCYGEKSPSKIVMNEFSPQVFFKVQGYAIEKKMQLAVTNSSTCQHLTSKHIVIEKIKGHRHWMRHCLLYTFYSRVKKEFFKCHEVKTSPLILRFFSWV